MTARILVVSDTHLHAGAGLPTAVLSLADRSDHVLHAGDLVDVDVLDTLEALAPVTGVCGNCDDGAVAARLAPSAAVELGGVRIELVHDAGAVDRRHDRLFARFPEADVVVYGHSHVPELVWSARGQLVVNPGSPTQRRRAPSHTVAWLEVGGGQVLDARLVHLD